MRGNKIFYCDSSLSKVDFEKEEILIPSKRILRRSFQTGLWIQRKVSAHQEQLHVKVNRLQIDNQMADCIFPVVLAPVPPPKSVAATSGECVHLPFSYVVPI